MPAGINLQVPDLIANQTFDEIPKNEQPPKEASEGKFDPLYSTFGSGFAQDKV
jgi:hypothetical protein